MDSLVHSMDQIGVWLLVIVLVAPIAIGLYTDDTSCGQGTVLEGHQCTPIGWQGEWTEIEMNFDYDKFSVNEGEHVRLVFSVPNEQDHYIPTTFDLDTFDISVNLPIDKEHTVEFFANKAGEFSYRSSGLCRVTISGGNTVIVDCSIFCGEIGNARIGTLVVNPTQISEVELEVNNV
tara:strand:+ start:1585 stop:2115 length:531 start_codon:yes stop_codon:yes gene_type:complete